MHAPVQQCGLVVGPAQWLETEASVVVDAGVEVLDGPEFEQQLHRQSSHRHARRAAAPGAATRRPET